MSAKWRAACFLNGGIAAAKSNSAGVSLAGAQNLVQEQKSSRAAQPSRDAMRWTINQVAHALDVPVPPGLNPMARLAGVSIDSRAVGLGELFIAIHGPRHDGHAFVGAALAAGSPAAVVAASRLGEYPQEIREKLLGVPETLAALQQLAHAIRREWGGRIAAVAGSVGKTTTKEILAALVASKFRVLKTEGNLNNEYGLPLTLLKLDDQHGA